MDGIYNRRGFLRSASAAALGLALGRSMLAGASWEATFSSYGALHTPSAGWRVAADEAFQSMWIVHEQWLYYVHQAGGLDDPRDTTRLLPGGRDRLEVYVPPSPYELAKVVERQRWFRDARSGNRRWSAWPSVPSETAALTTAELRSRLATVGVDANPEAFQALVEQTLSPWSIYCRWSRGTDLPSPEEDFLALAARELWCRTSPRPDEETLDDWAHSVLPDCDRGDPSSAYALGLAVWQQLRPRWPLETSTTADADQLWAGSLPMGNFVPALVRRLRETSAIAPHLSPTAIDIADDAIALFRDEGEDFLTELGRERALLRGDLA